MQDRNTACKNKKGGFGARGNLPKDNFNPSMVASDAGTGLNFGAQAG